MKIKVYGYYNYDNIHDQKEHLTVTPLCDVETDQRHDFSGNIYEFEYAGNLQLEYSKYYDKDCECELDQFVDISSKRLIQVNPDKFGCTHWCVISKNGCCYLIPDGEEIPESYWINLGNIKKHKV